MKKLIVISLEHVCTVLDKFVINYLPERVQMHWHHAPAMLSLDLDDKWHVGEWK